jgi:hypothetical protein
MNTGQAPLRVWRTGSRWGDEALSFEVIRGATAERIVRKSLIYTRNVPAPLTIPAGDSVRLPFDLGDGTWRSGGPLDDLIAPGAQFMALYEIVPSREAAINGVWIGRVRSDPVSLDGPVGRS